MKILPFYTSTGQRDDERVGSNETLLCPNYKLLPFQIQRDHLAGYYVNAINLVDCNANETALFDYFLGNEELITDWENGPNPVANYNTFADDGAGNILTAITSDSSNDWCYSTDNIYLATGQSIAVTYNLTLNSGSLPDMRLADAFGVRYSKSVTTRAGGDTICLTATGNASAVVKLLVENLAGNNTSFACSFSRVKRTSLVIDYFTSYDFISYNGEPLNTSLPYGVYYIKYQDGRNTWYSEWFSLENIQPQLLTGWPTDVYDTFNYSGTSIGTCISTGSTKYAFSNGFVGVFTGEKILFDYDLTLNSGQLPKVRLFSGSYAMSDFYTLTYGLNQVEITATYADTTAVYLEILNTAATNFAIHSASIHRKKGDYVHLEFTNTKDFNNSDKSIYYAGGFTQQAYLRAYENLPSHETIQIGDDKNGEFISEKLVSRYVRSVVSYESRTMYNALRLLPLHDSIKILDEVGIEHTPNAGNVDVNISWDTFDIGTLRLAWTEDNQYWTNSMDNIT